MRSLLRSSGIALVDLTASLLIAWAGAVKGLHEPRSVVVSLLESLALSGGLALALGVALTYLAMPFLRRLTLKVAHGYLIGSVAAIVSVVAMTPTILTSPRPLGLVTLYMVCFVVVSLGLAIIVSLRISQPVRALTVAVERVADGELGTRVEVTSRDEVAQLAGAFNRMADELGQTFARMREVDESRRRLIAAITHDLRTPLTAMRVTVEAILAGLAEGPEAIALDLQRVQNEIDQLSRLTDDLLDLSELEAGAGLRLLRVSLAELAVQTAAQLRPLAGERDVTMQVSSPGTATDMVLDPLQVQRLIGNLVLNAIQHATAGGTIEITTRVVGDAAVIEIEDTGEGIAPQDLPHIFEYFYRGDAARQQRKDGTGLGLAIAKAIAEAHGGTIEVESELGRGARFTVRLPVSPPNVTTGGHRAREM